MASPVQLRFTAASCKLLQITRLTKWIAIGVPQLHDPGGSNGISKRVLSRVLDEMHTLRCRQGHTFTRGINTGNLGKPVFVVSGSYVRAVSLSPFFFLLLLFLSFPLSFSFFLLHPSFGLCPVTYAKVEKVSLILQLLAWFFICAIWPVFFSFLADN